MKHDDGLSHHYRICEFGGFECLNTSSVIDTSAQKWGKSLISNVRTACNNIFDKDGCPVAPPLGSPW